MEVEAESDAGAEVVVKTEEAEELEVEVESDAGAEVVVKTEEVEELELVRSRRCGSRSRRALFEQIKKNTKKN